MLEEIKIEEERVSPEEYIDFLKRTDLGLQYPRRDLKKESQGL